MIVITKALFHLFHSNRIVVTCSEQKHASRFWNHKIGTNFSDTNRPHMADNHNEVIARFYDKIHRVFTKYWVVMCVAMFLIVSLEDDNVVAYKIIYMILFLAFVALYGVSALGRLIRSKSFSSSQKNVMIEKKFIVWGINWARKIEIND